MRGRYQIVVSHARHPASPDSPASGFWSRVKGALVAAGLMVAVMGLLAAALILGSIFAAVLLAGLVLIVGAAVVRGSWRRIVRDRR